MKMLQYLKKLDRNWRKKEYYMRLYRENPSNNKRKTRGILCLKEKGPPLKDYYAEKPKIVKQ